MNRGNARSAIFHKPEDYEALEQILAEGLTRYACRILAYELMPNHWHFVLQPTEDGGMSNFLRWVSLTHTMRLHDHYRTGESDQCLERSVPGTNYQDMDSGECEVCVVCEIREEWRMGDRKAIRTKRSVPGTKYPT